MQQKPKWRTQRPAQRPPHRLAAATIINALTAVLADLTANKASATVP